MPLWTYKTHALKEAVVGRSCVCVYTYVQETDALKKTVGGGPHAEQLAFDHVYCIYVPKP